MKVKFRSGKTGIIGLIFWVPHLPTYANKMQYIAANIGAGIDAKAAPNFAEIHVGRVIIL